MLALAAASVEALMNAQAGAEAGRSPSMLGADRAREVDRARASLEAWSEEVGAPPIELRRALRRISSSWAQTSRDQLRSALAAPDSSEAARLLVEALAAHDRDFEWDVPLRDVARALVRSAVDGARG
ncbi:MAG: hypothetical protein PVI23_10385 [Maricaulaceae bacterium]